MATGETLYAVIDTARDERLYPLVMRASDQACLFGGEIAEPLDRAAPYIVNLKPDEPLFRARRGTAAPVSYTHLTLPTKRIV